VTSAENEQEAVDALKQKMAAQELEHQEAERRWRQDVETAARLGERRCREEGGDARSLAGDGRSQDAAEESGRERRAGGQRGGEQDERAAETQDTAASSSPRLAAAAPPAAGVARVQVPPLKLPPEPSPVAAASGAGVEWQGEGEGGGTRPSGDGPAAHAAVLASALAPALVPANVGGGSSSSSVVEPVAQRSSESNTSSNISSNTPVAQRSSESDATARVPKPSKVAKEEGLAGLGVAVEGLGKASSELFGGMWGGLGGLVGIGGGAEEKERQQQQSAVRSRVATIEEVENALDPRTREAVRGKTHEPARPCAVTVKRLRLR
jgi:hypothetical protein